VVAVASAAVLALGGAAAASAATSGAPSSPTYWVATTGPASNAGYQPRDKTSSLPNPAKPAWVRPVDIYSFAAAIDPSVSGNRYDGKPYNP
jgi:hypothetical protein